MTICDAAGARLTTYNNLYNPVIADMNDIQHSVDRLLDGDTYVRFTEDYY